MHPRVAVLSLVPIAALGAGQARAGTLYAEGHGSRTLSISSLPSGASVEVLSAPGHPSSFGSVGFTPLEWQHSWMVRSTNPPYTLQKEYWANESSVIATMNSPENTYTFRLLLAGYQPKTVTIRESDIRECTTLSPTSAGVIKAAFPLNRVGLIAYNDHCSWSTTVQLVRTPPPPSAPAPIVQQQQQQQVIIAPTAPVAGCTKDTDCKGDRICEGGVCRGPN